MRQSKYGPRGRENANNIEGTVSRDGYRSGSLLESATKEQKDLLDFVEKIYRLMQTTKPGTPRYLNYDILIQSAIDFSTEKDGEGKIGGRRRKRKTRRKKNNKKNKRKTRRKKGGTICFTKKCRKNREAKRDQKKIKQTSKDIENLKYQLAWEVCDSLNKQEYDTCVNNIVNSNNDVNVDDILNTIPNLQREIQRRNISMPPGLSNKRANIVNPMLQQAGRKSRKKKYKKKLKKRRKTKRK